MVVGTCVTEIADSEEEPLTSSPAAVSDAAVDKLSVTARGDTKAVACLHQDPAGHIANELSCRTDCLNVDHQQPPTDINMTSVDCSDLQPVEQAKTDKDSTCTMQTDAQADRLRPQANLQGTEIERQYYCIGKQKDSHAGIPPGMLLLPEASSTTPSNETSREAREGAGDACRSPEREGSPVRSTSGDVSHDGTSTDMHQEVTCSPTMTLEPAPSLVMVLGDAPEYLEHGSAGVDSQHSLASGISGPDIDSSKPTSCDALLSSSEQPPAISNQSVPRNDSFPNGELIESAQHMESVAKETTQKIQDRPGVMSSATPPPRTAFPDIRKHELHGEHPRAQNNAEEDGEKGNEPEITDAGKETTMEESNTNEKTSTQASTTLSITQNSEVTSVSPQFEGAIVDQPHKQVAPTTATDFLTPHQNDPRLHEGRTTAPTIPGNSSSPQASKPASPHPRPALTPQEITLAELKAQKTALLASLQNLPAIQVLIEESQRSQVDMSDDDGEPTEADITAAANKIVKEHIRLLHDYNELKDIGQGLMGLIADQRGMRIVEVQDEFGIDAND